MERTAELKGGLFDPPGLGVWGRAGSEIGLFDSPPIGSYWLPIDTYGLPLTVLSY